MDGVSNLELAHDEALPRTKRMVVRTDEHQAHNARSRAVMRTADRQLWRRQHRHAVATLRMLFTLELQLARDARRTRKAGSHAL